jgi:hypothetical protein
LATDRRGSKAGITARLPDISRADFLRQSRLFAPEPQMALRQSVGAKYPLLSVLIGVNPWPKLASLRFALSPIADSPKMPAKA